jgi:hypothetical protein
MLELREGTLNVGKLRWQRLGPRLGLLRLRFSGVHPWKPSGTAAPSKCGVDPWGAGHYLLLAKTSSKDFSVKTKLSSFS